MVSDGRQRSQTQTTTQHHHPCSSLHSLTNTILRNLNFSRYIIYYYYEGKAKDPSGAYFRGLPLLFLANISIPPPLPPMPASILVFTVILITCGTTPLIGDTVSVFGIDSDTKFTVPQRFFLHFYFVAVVWTSFLLFLTWFYAYKMVPLGSESFEYPTVVSQLTGGSHSFSMSHSQLTIVEQKYSAWRDVFLLLLMEVQVWRRLYESLHVFNYSPSARMHIFGYLTGIFFYTAAPLSFCCACAPDVLNFTTQHVAEFIVKGREKMPIFEFDWSGYVEPLTKLGWCQWIGATIFIWGWIHQCHCHTILGALRKHKEQADEYLIPHGDWFELVSCPHYLAEIVIYAGILVASGGSDLTIWLLFAFVVANLGFAATETHRWYHRKFKNYPRTWRAIIPFIC